jgi:glycerophosphoryl diester phosphodiesterase
VTGAPLPYFASARPRVFAHRGLATGALENSLDAFRAALAVGADYLETDAHATADGHAVLLHDPGLKRLTELRNIAPVGEQICTLDEALRALPGARFNIDVKARAAAAPVAAAILAAGAADRVLITSFRSARRRDTLQRLPGVATSASAEQIVPAVLGAALGIQSLTRRALRDVQAVQIPERILGISTTSPRVLAAFHSAGVEVHIWTINDPTRMRELLDAGVDGIVTDRCDLLVTELGRGH